MAPQFVPTSASAQQHIFGTQIHISNVMLPCECVLHIFSHLFLAVHSTTQIVSINALCSLVFCVHHFPRRARLFALFSSHITASHIQAHRAPMCNVTPRRAQCTQHIFVTLIVCWFEVSFCLRCVHCVYMLPQIAKPRRRSLFFLFVQSVLGSRASRMFLLHI